jgi:hypothetical protein
MAVLERRLNHLFRHNLDCQKIADIPGVTTKPKLNVPLEKHRCRVVSHGGN